MGATLLTCVGLNLGIRWLEKINVRDMKDMEPGLGIFSYKAHISILQELFKYLTRLNKPKPFLFQPEILAIFYRAG